jgi:predicted amidophosphoribosyltransferase
VPLPLHAKRYLHRRFNQWAKLARLLHQQNQTGICAPEALTRQKAGPTQAKMSRSQRQRNLASAFAMPQDQRQRIANRPVLLIDDVMTTGTTLYEAAKTLIGGKWPGSRAGLDACFAPWVVTSFIQC